MNSYASILRVRRWKTAIALLSLLLAPIGVRADVFVTTGGERVEGELLEELKDAYRIRTFLGIVDLEKERVATVVRKASPWAKYESRRLRCAGTAQAHFELAQWCKRHQLGIEAKDELERAIQIDPNHALAREELGYVRGDDGRWSRPKSKRAPSDEERAAKRRQKDEERLVRKLVTNWFVKVKAIQKGRLTPRGSAVNAEKLAEGRELILAIRDPLAIPAISGVLSTGGLESRILMVDALSNFKEDEATMNLLVATLLDPSRKVRSLAAQALSPRKDRRVVARLTDALFSSEEDLLRNAATALGAIKAHDAVEALISVLSKEVKARVLVSRPVFLDSVRSDFGGFNRYYSGSRLLRYQPTSIYCLGPGTMIGTVSSSETRTVTIFRTEVQEALIAITGQNFGFDPDAWRTWWADQQGGKK